MSEQEDLAKIKSVFNGTYNQSGEMAIAHALYLGLARIADAIKEIKK